MDTKFEAGQMVICIDAGETSCLTVGKEYEVVFTGMLKPCVVCNRGTVEPHPLSGGSYGRFKLSGGPW